MTPKQLAAARALAEALAVPERKPIPKELAGRVLLEATNAMAEGAGRHASIPTGKPTEVAKGSAYAQLVAYLRGTDDEN